jgi:fructokinase
MAALTGGIEAGGTKFVCGIGTGPDDLRATKRFETLTPRETIPACVAWFRQQQKQHGDIAALGIASFGPVDLHDDSPTYGCITTTPKKGWENTSLVGPIRDELGVPVAFDTDVNGAALAEGRWGAAKGLDTFVYLTIGTGIGGGAMVGGEMLHGMLHPEMGHILIPHDRERDPYKGHCRKFHYDCFEGLACGPAIQERWGTAGEDLPTDHPAWALEAHYVALALVNIMGILSPQRIILGGGVMQQKYLFSLIRAEVPRLIKGYLSTSELKTGIEEYIVAPGLGDKAGVLGALALGQDALRGMQI